MKTWYMWVICLLLCVWTRPSGAEMTIKLGVVTKPGSAQNIVAEQFKALVEQRSGGRVGVKIFDSASIGNETEILQQIQMNAVQMGVITAGPFDTFDPVVRVVNYPFLFKDHAQVDRVLDGPLGRELLRRLEGAGFKGLCFSENGFRHLTNSRWPVRAPADVEGLKIRVMSSALHKAIWETLGANPTPMPWPIYTELEQGVIDGQENPLWVLEVYRFYEIQRYLTLTHHVYSPHVDVASLRWWNGLDGEDQALIERCMHDAAVFQRQKNRAENAARLKLLKSKGMAVVDHPDLDAFRAKVAGLKDSDLYREAGVQGLLLKMMEATRE